jgi:hypothetical protein
MTNETGSVIAYQDGSVKSMPNSEADEPFAWLCTIPLVERVPE